MLLEWEHFLPRFVRMVPNDYKRVLEAQRKMRETGMSEEEAEMAALELNAQDAARVGGLLVHGIPNMNLDKGVVERRVSLMAAEGVDRWLKAGER